MRVCRVITATSSVDDVEVILPFLTSVCERNAGSLEDSIHIEY